MISPHYVGPTSLTWPKWKSKSGLPDASDIVEPVLFLLLVPLSLAIRGVLVLHKVRVDNQPGLLLLGRV